MRTLALAATFVLMACLHRSMQERRDPIVTVAKEDGAQSSVCRLLVDNEERWAVELPLLHTLDWDNAGSMAAIGEVSLSYGTGSQSASALVIVNSLGKCVLTEAYTPVRSWPHGDIYPRFISCHALRKAAVFRLVAGPGSREVWRIYDAMSGARLNELDLARILESALPEKSFAAIGSVEMLKDAQLLFVACVPGIEQSKSRLRGAHAGRGRVHEGGISAAAVVDLLGRVRWWRIINADDAVKLLGVKRHADGYSVELSSVGGSETRCSVLRVVPSGDDWLIDDAAW